MILSTSVCVFLLTFYIAVPEEFALSHSANRVDTGDTRVDNTANTASTTSATSLPVDVRGVTSVLQICASSVGGASFLLFFALVVVPCVAVVVLMAWNYLGSRRATREVRVRSVDVNDPRRHLISSSRSLPRSYDATPPVLPQGSNTRALSLSCGSSCSLEDAPPLYLPFVVDRQGGVTLAMFTHVKEDAVKVVRTDSHKTVARFKLLGQDIVFEPAESATGNPVVRISTHTECHGGVRGQRCVKVFYLWVSKLCFSSHSTHLMSFRQCVNVSNEPLQKCMSQQFAQYV